MRFLLKDYDSKPFYLTIGDDEKDDGEAEK